MNELIKIEVNENQEIIVSARDLHKGLGITERFSNWFKRQLKYGFEENIDYIGCKFFNTLAKQELDDYNIKLDMAKEICMLQRSEKGREYRKYLIECEKKLREQDTPSYMIQDPIARAVRWIEEERKRQELQKQNEIMLPKADYFDNLVERNLLTNFRDTAKELHIKERAFIKWLLENKYVYRDSKNKLKPYSQYVDSGLFEIKEFGNSKFAGTQTLVTPKGRETFRLLYSENN